MPTEKGASKTNDLGDALVSLVHAGQAVRRAGRGRVIGIAKEALSTTAKVVGALGDL